MTLTWLVYKDLLSETQAAIGKSSIQGEGGVRSHVAEASDDTGTDLLAVAAVESSAGTTHGSLSGVPYQRVLVKKFGPRKWRVVQFFGWGPDVRWGGSSATTAARFHLGTGYVECYTVGPAVSDGLPETMIGTTPGSTTSPVTTWYDCPQPTYFLGRRPRPYQFEIAQIAIRIPFRSNSAPLTSAIVACMNKVNSATVTFLSANAVPLVLTAGQCKFVGADVDWRVNSSYAFNGDFCFLARPSWNIQYVLKNSGTLLWECAKKTTLASANFTTAFGVI